MWLVVVISRDRPRMEWNFTRPRKKKDNYLSTSFYSQDQVGKRYGYLIGWFTSKEGMNKLGEYLI